MTFFDGFSDELCKLAQGEITMPPLNVRTGRHVMKPQKAAPGYSTGTVTGLAAAKKMTSPKATLRARPAARTPGTGKLSDLERMRRYGPSSGYFGKKPTPVQRGPAAVASVPVAKR